VAIEEAGNAALESTEDAEGAASDDLDLDAYINDLADELAEEVSDEVGAPAYLPAGACTGLLGARLSAAGRWAARRPAGGRSAPHLC
jgi:hypothetical protein